MRNPRTEKGWRKGRGEMAQDGRAVRGASLAGPGWTEASRNGGQQRHPKRCGKRWREGAGGLEGAGV